jgi:hypothetical protein
MQLKTTASWVRPTVALAALWMMLCASAPLGANAASKKMRTPSLDERSASALIAEVRRSFTLHGKTIPPEIFRDFGDGDLADSGSIWVTVDIAATIGSNLYFDDIRSDGPWVSQKKLRQKTDVPEETAYTFIGSTKNGLLVVLATYNGGGSGIFYTLHILDVAASRGLDFEGKIYQRINLTNLRNVILGDRWEGRVTISNNAVRIVTDRSGPAEDAGPRAPITIVAKRP